ncbi:MAG TPA: ABC transporter permease subunit [Pirellulales bacterium]|nr:ABC transporter permease subunit [Pirellulales bacterium]
MIWFICKRLVWMAITLWVVFTISFFLMRAVPGGPFSAERKLAPEIKKNVEHRYHLDDPLWKQYADELVNALRFDLGYSQRLGDFSVNEVIAAGFPKSATLGVLALVFALSLGFAAGVVSAVRRGSFLDFSLMSAATIGIALPNFVIAGLAIMLFAFVWPIFPAAGFGTLRQVVLPSLCLGAPYAAEVARLVRTGMLDVMGQDYIRTAYAKGLMTRAVIMRHALKGALLPLVSYLGPAISGIVTGSIVIEMIFAIPGLGYHFVQAALQRDYTLAMGLVLLDTALLVALNLLVDVVYTILDPRVKLDE